MMDIWALVRFVHIVGAALWVGGQLALALIVTPLARKLIGPQQTTVMGAFGRRFARLTLAAALPLQVATGIGLAVHNGVTWASLAEPGYGRTLAGRSATQPPSCTVSTRRWWTGSRPRSA